MEDILRSCANEECEKLFEYSRPHNIYCSTKCALRAKYVRTSARKNIKLMPILKQCKGCGLDYLKIRNGQTHCDVCKKKKSHSIIPCKTCGLDFLRIKSEQFCSDICRRKAWITSRAKYMERVSAGLIPILAHPGKKKGIKKGSIKKVELICKHCGKIFLGNRYKSLYCERKCFKKAYFLRGKELLLPPPNVCVDLPNEIWKEIPTLQGLFEVSSFGRVRQSFSYKRRSHSNRFYPGRIRTPYRMPSGFDKIMICVSSDKYQSTSMFVHILVASVFIPNPLKLDWVIHKDGDRRNNRVTNLAWSENKVVTSQLKKSTKAPAYKRGSYNKKWRAIKEKELQRRESFFSKVKKTMSRIGL